MDIVKAAKEYSKTIETGEDPNDFDDILQKQTEMSKTVTTGRTKGVEYANFRAQNIRDT